MNRFIIHLLTFLVSLSITFVFAQENRSQLLTNNGQDENIFHHTVERGQTVYAISAMYNVDRGYLSPQPDKPRLYQSG